MDLRVEIIAISRMTCHLAATPGKAPEFGAETETGAADCRPVVVMSSPMVRREVRGGNHGEIRIASP
ncbi:MAG: hypothetical protein ACREEJ_03730 [Ensifer adhaerens]